MLIGDSIRSCPTCHTILPTDPYRQSSFAAMRSSTRAQRLLAQMKIITSFNFIKKLLALILNTVAGSVALAAGAALLVAAYFIVGSGVYHIGHYAFCLLGSDPQTWTCNDNGKKVIPWFFGVVILCLPFLAYFIGESINSRWKR